MYSRDDHSDRNSDCDADDTSNEELHCGTGRREDASDRGGYGQPVDHQCGRVVDHALALENADDFSRHAEGTQDRKNSHWIRRRDDRAERDRGGPGEGGVHRVRDHGDRGRRYDDHDDGETNDWPDLAPEVTKRIGDCPGVKEGRNENEKQDVRLQRDFRESRNEREQETADHEDGGIRNRESLSDQAKSRRNCQKKENELEAGQDCSRR